MAVRLESRMKVTEMRKRQADSKAARLVNMVQANASLEGQGLDRASLNEQRELLVEKLLGGSARKLWDSL